MHQLDDKVDLAGSGDGTSMCVTGGGGSQILAVHSITCGCSTGITTTGSCRGNTCRLLPMVDHSLYIPPT